MTFTKGGSQQAMTVATVNCDNDTSFMMGGMFYMAAPDTGANKTLTWDWVGAGSASEEPKCVVTFWSGVDFVRDADANQFSGLAFTTPTLTAQTGDLIVAWAFWYCDVEGTINSWSNLTELSEFTKHASGAADGALATGTPSGDTTVAASTGSNVQDGGIVAIVLVPAEEGGEEITGTGVLVAGAASADGAGVSGSTGTGALIAQAAAADGAGVSLSTGTGALASGAADVTGSGTVEWTGVGILEAIAATIAGSGISLSTGTGALQAQAASVNGSEAQAVAHEADVWQKATVNLETGRIDLDSEGTDWVRFLSESFVLNDGSDYGMIGFGVDFIKGD